MNNTLTKYKLGDLITQRREKNNNSENLPISGVSKSRKKQIHHYIICFIVEILFSILPVWNLIQLLIMINMIKQSAHLFMKFFMFIELTSLFLNFSH